MAALRYEYYLLVLYLYETSNQAFNFALTL